MIYPLAINLLKNPCFMGSKMRTEELYKQLSGWDKYGTKEDIGLYT